MEACLGRQGDAHPGNSQRALEHGQAAPTPQPGSAVLAPRTQVLLTWGPSTCTCPP